MAEQFTNDLGTTLAAAINSTTRPVTFSVTSGATWPTQPQFRVILGTAGSSEILLVSAVNGGNLYTASTAEGSTAQTWPAGTPATHILTAGAIAQLKLDIVAYIPVWVKITVPYTALTAAATTQTITLTGLNSRQILNGIVLKQTTAFSGGSITNLTVNVGDSVGGTSYYFNGNYSVSQTVGNTAFAAVNVLGLGSFAGSNLTLTFNATGGNVNTTTAGSLDVDLALANLP